MPRYNMPTTQYLRFTPLKRRDGQNVNEYALCEFRIYNGGSEVSLSGTTVTSAGYSGDPLSNLVDNVDNNKIFPFSNPLVMNFGSQKTFTQYRYVFMNAQVDHPAYGRTPIRWTLETSSDGTNWTMFDDRSASDQTIAAALIDQWGEFPADGPLYPLEGGGGGGAPAPYCLAEGTQVLTPYGYVSVESLKNKDYVITGDKRIVAIKSIFSTTYSKTTKQTAPYTIEPHAFGKHCPPNALTVSGRHAVQIAEGLWEMPEEAAKSNKHVKQAPIGSPVTYYHVALPDYAKDTLVANGQIVESLNDKQYKESYLWNSKLGGYERKLAKYVSKTLSH